MPQPGTHARNLICAGFRIFTVSHAHGHVHGLTSGENSRATQPYCKPQLTGFRLCAHAHLYRDARRALCHSGAETALPSSAAVQLLPVRASGSHRG